VRGLAYLKARRGREAVQEFQKLIDNPGIMDQAVTAVVAHLQAARAKILSGDIEAACGCYQDFLGLWKDADPDIPIFREAKSEYARLYRTFLLSLLPFELPTPPKRPSRMEPRRSDMRLSPITAGQLIPSFVPLRKLHAAPAEHRSFWPGARRACLLELLAWLVTNHAQLRLPCCRVMGGRQWVARIIFVRYLCCRLFLR